jgi:hypothetical protein
MPAHITTEEAKKQSLPGFDVYRYSHLLYHDALNRDSGVVRLNVEAIKAFSDTVTIAKRNELAAEQAVVKHWLAQGGINTNLPFPWGDATRATMEYVNYEHLKIASAFELHLKARLLSRNYVLHEIDSNIPGYKSLASEQSKRPIEKCELIAIQPYHFDGKQNYLPGLREASLKFSWLTDKPAYKATLGLNDQQLDIIRDYRLLRNQVHFPGDILEAPSIQAFPRPIIEFLTEFINSEIVAWSNSLITEYDMNYKPLVPF